MLKAILLTMALSVTAFQQCGRETPPEYNRLFKLPPKQQAEEFRKYPLEQQADIYVYALGWEPPETQFSNYLAGNGKSAIPVVLRRLREEQDDELRFRFIEVFYDMHTQYCSLKNEAEVTATIRATISRMKDLDWKRFSEMSLKAITEKPGANGPC